MGLCFICTTIIYCKIYITVRRHTKEINGTVYKFHSRKQKNGELANVARRIKSAVGTFFIYLVFLACFFPEYCSLLLDTFLHNPHSILMYRFPPPGGYSLEFLVGVCRPHLQIQTQFQTQKCHFPHPFSHLASKIHTRFQT